MAHRRPRRRLRRRRTRRPGAVEVSTARSPSRRRRFRTACRRRGPLPADVRSAAPSTGIGHPAVQHAPECAARVAGVDAQAARAASSGSYRLTSRAQPAPDPPAVAQQLPFRIGRDRDYKSGHGRKTASARVLPACDKTRELMRRVLLLPDGITAMSDRDTFGPRLRSERERRGISLETIATVTKVGAELWEGLERNDFSRWPTGIFARAFVRDYARAVGLDADEVVDEFCRLFPIGDRRAERMIKAQAQLIGHNVGARLAPMIPPTGDRRASRRPRAEQARARRIRARPAIGGGRHRHRRRAGARDRRVACCSTPASGPPPGSSGSRTTPSPRSRSATRRAPAPWTPCASGCRRCSPCRTVAARTRNLAPRGDGPFRRWEPSAWLWCLMSPKARMRLTSPRRSLFLPYNRIGPS